MTDLKPTAYTNKTISIPKPVGYWVLYKEEDPNLYFAMYQKPTDEQLLGWQWRDA